jgi:threonine/homoserine/homoserine lactone efflux protein
MDTFILLKGIIIGFSIAAPVGPIGVLCIRRTLADGRLTGFLSGLGAATADLFYGAIAAFGLTFISDLLVGQAKWLNLIGGLFLVYLGVKTFLANPSNESAKSNANGLFGAYISTFFLTITNPLTILSFIAIFAGIQTKTTDNSYATAVTTTIGVFIGSAAWWLTLSGLISLVRDRFTSEWMKWVNRFAGLIIFTFGIKSLFFN